MSQPTVDEPRCLICGSPGSVFFQLAQQPVHVGRLWSSKEEALACPRGDIHLARCPHCGMIWNARFDPSLMPYEGEYDNSLFFSAVHREHARRCAERLIERYDLRHKDILEIGCGTGEFLGLLCELGSNRGVGFDPGCPSQSDAPPGVTFVRDQFDDRSAGRSADLICSRYLLEHVSAPVDFLRRIRSFCERTGAVTYCEVPNAALIFRQRSVWDIIYEHVSIFSETSLARAFQVAGFEICDLGEGNRGQALWIEARVGSAKANVFEVPHQEGAMAATAADFQDDFQQLLDDWQDRLRQYARDGRTVVAWGAGAKGISFLNMLQVRDGVRYIVDVNPRKKGHFIPCTGQEIIAPDSLRGVRPDIVIVMNPIYESEIRDELRTSSPNAEIVCV